MMKNQPLALDDFFESTTKDLEKKIATTIADKKIILILNHGKRLRPLLAHLSFKVCTGGRETPYQYQKALEGTVAIELAHTASLVHDDIIDKDKERRGKPAFYIKEGIPNALLTGHRMLAIGFDIALRHGNEIAKLYIDTWNEILSGELKEVNFNKKEIENNSHDEISTKSKFFSEYNKIINMKTASLFSSACKAGAIEAEASGEILIILADYGREIGLAYQLADDLVDLENGEMLDSVIVPLLDKLEDKTVNNSFRLRSIRKKLAKNSSKIKQLYIEEIKRHVKKAKKLSKSEKIPSSPYKELLIDAPAYFINKMLREIKTAI